MSLLHELGLGARIPSRVARGMARAIDEHYLRVFPVRPEEMPPGKDGARDVACHCALGNMLQVLHDRGTLEEGQLSWVRPWFIRYQLPDGGLNCDEAAYLKPEPHSSFLSTVPAAEAMLRCTDRAFTADESQFLGRAAEYLLRRRLCRSLSKGMAIADPQWLTPCFPRFYDYDLLRGLRFLAELGARPGAKLPRADLAEPIAAVEQIAADGGARLEPRRPLAGWTLRRDPTSGAWERVPGPASFALLDEATRREVAVPRLLAEWKATRAMLEGALS